MRGHTNKFMVFGIMATALLVAVGCDSSSGKLPENADEQQAASIQGVDDGTLTVNVDLTDQGFVPASYHIPQGKRVQLVVRNRGATEHHYHIKGLIPQDMLWMAKGGIAADQATEGEASISAAEAHDHGHDTGPGLLPYHICISSRLCPTGDSVHAHAEVGGTDKIIFTATNLGTFKVEDPLHTNLVGTVTVY